MRLGAVPLSYTLRGFLIRRTSTILTVVGIGATVAVIAGVLALQQGFQTLFSTSGREDVAIFLRPGATSETQSIIRRDQVDILTKSTPEIALAEDGQPLASAETFLALRLRKNDGGETNVPIRGVQPMSFELFGDDLRITEGRRFEPGTDEIVVGAPLVERIRGASIGDVIVLNVTPFRVVGVFEQDGPAGSEIWGDAERILTALERPSFSRIVARLNPGVSAEELSERLEFDRQAPAKVVSETEYLNSQTLALSITLWGLGIFLAVIMGTAAVFTGTNTMLAALAARTHEIGILLSIGFRPFWIFVSFMVEAALLGLFGGVLGALLVVPLNGIRTGTTNWATFTEIAFAFQVTPIVLGVAVAFALALGLLGGAWPALRASLMDPVEAVRHR